MVNFRRREILGTTILTSALVLSACSLYGTPSGTGGQTGQNQQQAQASPQQSAATVTFSDSGVDQTTVTVKSGQAITWTNSGSKTIQVASANHPTHTLNPELSNGQFVLDLAPGASSTVTLNKIGTWGFHNHLNPSVTGKVVVE